MPLWHGSSRYFHNLCTSYWHGDASVDFHLEFNEHTGTHVDAPAHFVREEDHPHHKWIDEIGAETLIASGRALDFSNIGRDAVSADDVRAWESSHGALVPGEIVLFNLGWASKWRTLPEGNAYIENWPHLTGDCAELMVQRGARAIGTDTLTPDPCQSADYPVHRTLLSNGVLIIENLARLDGLPEHFVFMGLPLKIKQGSGSPLRALALTEPASDGQGN
jgi:kynurenine formamidase